LVSELLTASGQWNEELIRAVFIPVDANAILRIPVRPQDDDWWAWELEKHGEYSVKSTYRKLVAMKEADDDMRPGGSGDASWKKRFPRRSRYSGAGFFMNSSGQRKS
jgi:hypothetical protein